MGSGFLEEAALAESRQTQILLLFQNSLENHDIMTQNVNNCLKAIF